MSTTCNSLSRRHRSSPSSSSFFSAPSSSISTFFSLPAHLLLVSLSVFLLLLSCLSLSSSGWQIEVIQPSDGSVGVGYTSSSQTVAAWDNGTKTGWIKPNGGFKLMKINVTANYATMIHGSLFIRLDYFPGGAGNLTSLLDMTIVFNGTALEPEFWFEPEAMINVVITPNTVTLPIPMQKCTAPGPLQSILPPVLLPNSTGFLHLDRFTLAWEWNTVFARTLPSMKMLLSNGSEATHCNLPSLTREVGSDCTEVHKIAFDWSNATAQNCFYAENNVNNSVASGKTVYAGNLLLSTNETVYLDSRYPKKAFLRTVEYQFLVNMLFSQFAVVSSEVIVLAPVDVVSVVVSQIHKNSISPPTTFVNIITQIGYPYKLSLFHPNGFVVNPSGYNNNKTTAVLSSVDLAEFGYPTTFAANREDVSQQGWQLQIVPGSGACQVDGIYNGSSVLLVACVDPTSIECDPPIDTSVAMSVVLTSENFCGQVVSDIGATLLLSSMNSNFDEPGPGAILIQPSGRAYFSLKLLKSSTLVSVSSMTLDRVLISTPSMTSPPFAVLFGETPALGYEEYSSGDPLEKRFSFLTDNNAIFRVGTADTSRLSLTVRAKIAYVGVQKKRSIEMISANGESLTETTTQVTLQYKSSSASTLSVASFISIIVSLVVAMYY